MLTFTACIQVICTVVLVICTVVLVLGAWKSLQRSLHFFFQTLPRVLTRHCFILVGATAVYLATWGTFLGRTVGVRGFGDKGIVMAGSGPAATQKGLCTAQFCFKMPYLNGYAGKWFLYSTSICMFFLPHVYTSDMPQIYANILYIHFL